ncbi:MAG: TIGR03084 family metal-binding protein [Pseudomonadota bacterium]
MTNQQMQQALDFQAECESLEALLRPLPPEDFSRSTGFKSWTVDNVLRHLHVWNVAADLSLQDEDAFKEWLANALPKVMAGDLTSFETEELNGLAGPDLLNRWATFYPQTAQRFAETDPSKRLVWAGPSMSARSSITARLMESWAHGQAIYDELGVKRKNADRIKNIVVIGVNTYGWTFKNRGETPPEPMPHLVLTAPSGTLWEFGEPSESEKITGLAEEFCQVVTQCRNIADTKMSVEGENAKRWMAVAQCFAGPPMDPPAPGLRKMRC